MDTKQAVKKILKNENTTQKELAKKLGYAYATGVSTLLAKNNPTVDKLIRILDAIGYEIVLRPKNGTNKVSRSVILDNK